MTSLIKVASPLLDDNNEETDIFCDANDGSNGALASSSSSSSLPVINCCHSMHDGVELMDQILPMSVDDVFKLVFLDSPFFRALMVKRQTHSLSIGEWTELEANKLEEFKEFKKFRMLTYTIELNQTMAKSVTTTETQYLYEQSIPGQAYMIKSEATNSGVPLSKSFQVNTYFCLTRGKHENECNLKIHGQVVFKKNAWGMKSLIEGSSIQGISSYCDDLTTSLLEWVQTDGKTLKMSTLPSFLPTEPSSLLPESIVVTCAPLASLSNSLKQRKRRSSSSSSSISPNLVEQKSNSRDSTLKARSRDHSLRPKMDSSFTLESTSSNIDKFVVKIVFVTLVILLALNCFLYLRLWKLEESAKVLQSALDYSESSSIISHQSN